MGKRHISYLARDRLRQVDEFREPTFMPTISVERHIIIDEAAAEDYHAKLKSNLKSSLRRSQLKHYRILDPSTLRLKMVENVPVALPQAREMVEELGSHLLGLLERAPQWMALPVGQIACFSETNPRRQFHNSSVVGVEPNGWRGPDANYATHDKNGLRTPIGLLAEEGEVCERLLGPVVKTPYAAIVTNSAGISARELRDVQSAAYESLPEEFEWQDPVIYLRTGRGRNSVETFNIRAPNVYDLVA